VVLWNLKAESSYKHQSMGQGGMFYIKKTNIRQVFQKHHFFNYSVIAFSGFKLATSFTTDSISCEPASLRMATVATILVLFFSELIYI